MAHTGTRILWTRSEDYPDACPKCGTRAIEPTHEDADSVDYTCNQCGCLFTMVNDVEEE